MKGKRIVTLILLLFVGVSVIYAVVKETGSSPVAIHEGRGLPGVLYTAGRALTYTILGFVLVRSMSSLPVISHFLQKYMNIILGPLLVVAGMVLLDLISFGSGVVFRQKKSRVQWTEPVFCSFLWACIIHSHTSSELRYCTEVGLLLSGMQRQ